MKYAFAFLLAILSYLFLGVIGVFLCLCILFIFSQFFADFILVTGKTQRLRILLAVRILSQGGDENPPSLKKKLRLVYCPLPLPGQKERTLRALKILVKTGVLDGRWTSGRAAKMKFFLEKAGIGTEHFAGLLRMLVPKPVHAYQTLGLPEDSSWNRVLERYRELLKQNHPDLHPQKSETRAIENLKRALELIREEKGSLFAIESKNSD
jgi:hypothetical protein